MDTNAAHSSALKRLKSTSDVGLAEPEIRRVELGISIWSKPEYTPDQKAVPQASFSLSMLVYFCLSHSLKFVCAAGLKS